MNDSHKLALATAVGGLLVGAVGGAAIGAAIYKWNESVPSSKSGSVTSMCTRCSVEASPMKEEAGGHRLPTGDGVPLAEYERVSAMTVEVSQTLKLLMERMASLEGMMKSRTVSRSGTSSSLGGYATANESLDQSPDEGEMDDEEFLDPPTDVSGDEIYFTTRTHHSTSNGKSGILKQENQEVMQKAFIETEEPVNVGLYAAIDVLLCSEKTEDNDRGFELLQQLKTSVTEWSTDCNYLWRLAKSIHQKGLNSQDAESKKAFAFQAKDIAFQAADCDGGPLNAEVNKWCAITIGNIGEYVTLAEKITNGCVFKEKIDEAIRINSENHVDDEMNYYLLGRWNYSVYMIPWYQRTAVSALVPNFPSATIDEALEAFIEAEAYKPGHWVDTRLFLAKCYIEKADYCKAIEWLDKGAEMERKSEDEESFIELDGLRAKYSSYRIR